MLSKECASRSYTPDVCDNCYPRKTSDCDKPRVSGARRLLLAAFWRGSHTHSIGDDQVHQVHLNHDEFVGGRRRQALCSSMLLSVSLISALSAVACYTSTFLSCSKPLRAAIFGLCVQLSIRPEHQSEAMLQLKNNQWVVPEDRAARRNVRAVRLSSYIWLTKSVSTGQSLRTTTRTQLWRKEG